LPRAAAAAMLLPFRCGEVLLQRGLGEGCFRCESTLLQKAQALEDKFFRRFRRFCYAAGGH
jgi:hypothetical protein